MLSVACWARRPSLGRPAILVVVARTTLLTALLATRRLQATASTAVTWFTSQHAEDRVTENAEHAHALSATSDPPSADVREPCGSGRAAGVFTPTGRRWRRGRHWFRRPTSPSPIRRLPKGVVDAGRAPDGGGRRRPRAERRGWTVDLLHGCYRALRARARPTTPSSARSRSASSNSGAWSPAAASLASDVDQADAPAGDDLADANVVAEDVVVDTPTPAGDNRADVRSARS